MRKRSRLASSTHGRGGGGGGGRRCRRRALTSGFYIIYVRQNVHVSKFRKICGRQNLRAQVDYQNLPVRRIESATDNLRSLVCVTVTARVLACSVDGPCVSTMVSDLIAALCYIAVMASPPRNSGGLSALPVTSQRATSDGRSGTRRQPKHGPRLGTNPWVKRPCPTRRRWREG